MRHRTGVNFRKKFIAFQPHQYLIAEFVLYPLDGRAHLVEKQELARPAVIQFFEGKPYLFERFERLFVVLRRDHHADDLGKGREGRSLAQGYFMPEKTLVIVVHGKAQDVIFGVVRLQNDFARLFRTPAPARDLRDELKGAFAAPVIGKMQAHVRVEYAHEGDRGEVVPLCHHLRADEDVRLALRKRFEYFIMPFLARSRVVVHAQDARGRKQFFQFPHDLLRARARIA